MSVGVGITYEYNSMGASKANREMMELSRNLDRQRAGFDQLRQIAGGAMDKIQAGLGYMNRILDEVAQGAASLDIGEAFRAAGAAVPSLERLRAATQGIVDNTALQQWATLQARLGLTADEIEGLSAQLTHLAITSGNVENIGRILQQSVNGGAEAYRQLGVAVDNSDPKYKGLTETQKKLAVAQDLAAQGAKRLGQDTDSHAAATARLQTAMANLQSSFQESLAAKAEESGSLERLTETADSLGGALGSMGAGLESAAALMGLLGPVIEIVATNMELFTLSMYPATKVLGLLADGLQLGLDLLSDAGSAVVSWGKDLLGLGDGVAYINDTWDRMEGIMRSSAEAATEHAEALQENVYPATEVRDKILDIIEKGEEFKGVLDGKNILLYRDALELLTEELDLASAEFEYAVVRADELQLALEGGTYKRGSDAFARVYQERQTLLEEAQAKDAEIAKKRADLGRATYALEAELAERDNALKDKLGANAESRAKDRADRMLELSQQWFDTAFEDVDARIAETFGFEATNEGYAQMTIALEQWRRKEHEALYGSMDDWVARMDALNTTAQAELDQLKQDAKLKEAHKKIAQDAAKDAIAAEQKKNSILQKEGEAAAGTLLSFALGASWAEHLQGIYSASAKAVEYAFTPGLEWAAVGQIAAIAEHAAAMANAESMGAKKSGGGSAKGAARGPSAQSVGVPSTAPAGSFGAEEIGNTTAIIMFDGAEVGKAVIRGANDASRYGLTSSMQGRRGWQ